MSFNANAVNISTDQIGEVAIVPYYNARENFQTIFSMVNTRDVPMVVKVRVHEGRNSRDVLDFNVALSAFDVFSAALRTADIDGLDAPAIQVFDQADDLGRRTCTIPSVVGIPGNQTPLSPLAFGPPGTTDDDGGPIGDAPGVYPDIGLNAEAAARMEEGYIEFIVMGYALGTDGGVGGGSLGSVGSAIESHNCGVLDSAFIVDNILQTARQFGEPINALKVNASLLNVDEGFETNIPVLMLANFYNPEGVTPGGSPVTTPPQEMGQVVPAVTPADNAGCDIDRGEERRDNGVNWFPDGSDGSCMNLITAQVVPDFLEPTLNDAYPQVANYWDDSRNFPAYAVPYSMILCPTIDGDTPPDCGASEHVRGVDAVSLLIQRAAVFNEWTNNSAITDTSSDWILTLPTKGFYVDGNNGNNNLGWGLQSAVVPGGVGNLYVDADGFNQEDGGRDETILDDGFGNEAMLPYPPFVNSFGQQLPDGTPMDGREYANSCNRVGVTVYDRAEQSAGEPPDGGPIVSPAPPPVIATLNLCYETNVIDFDGISALNSQYPLLNTDGSAVSVDTDGLFSDTGDNDAGWMSLRLDTEDGAYINAWQADGPFDGQMGSTRGLPVTGFLLRQRTFGNIANNNATSFEHSYQRYYDDFQAPEEPEEPAGN